MIGKPKEGKPYLSASQLEMYWRCGEQYRRRYMEHERIPPGVARLIGKGIHGGAEVNFRQKLASYDDLPKAEIVEAAVTAFDAEVHGEGFLLSEEEASRGPAKVIGEAKDKTAQLAAVHAEQQAPEYQPVAVEQKTRILFPKATHDLLTVSDLWDDKDRVTDFKTAARKPNGKPPTDADTSIQLTAYAAAFQVENGIRPAEVRLDVLTKTKTPGRHVLTSRRGPDDYQVFINRVNVTLCAINAGIFPPASPGAWQCSERWCGYSRDCPYYHSPNNGG